MVFDLDQLRDAVRKKYGVIITTPYWRDDWSADTSLRTVHEPAEYKDNQWLYSILHEIGHIENNHDVPRDIYDRVRHEAEAWRWALNEARALGLEIPQDYIRECMDTYTRAFSDKLRDLRDRFGKDVWWAENRKIMNGEYGEIVYSG